MYGTFWDSLFLGYTFECLKKFTFSFKGLQKSGLIITYSQN